MRTGGGFTVGLAYMPPIASVEAKNALLQR